MASNFPADLDSLTRVTSTDYLDTPGKQGDVIITALQEAVEAAQTVIGKTGSTNAATLQYRLGSVEQNQLKSPSKKSFTVQVSAGAVYVRTEWDATWDSVQKVLIDTARTAYANNPVEFGGARKIYASAAASATASEWASTGASNPLANQLDDAPPMFYNSTWIGGNHGASIAKLCTATAHGKTQADIGSLWDGPYTKNYTIARIVDANTLLIFSEKGAASLNTDAYWGQEVTTLTGVAFPHISGATNNATFTVASSSTAQITPVLSRRSVVMKINGSAVGTTDAVYSCTSFTIEENYSIVNPPLLFDWLRANVGTLTNNWTPSDSVGVDSTVFNNWAFQCNGCVVNRQTLTFPKSVTFGYAGAQQALAPYYSGKVLSGYVPGCSSITVGANTYDLTAMANLATIPADVPLNSASWLDAKKPPNRMAEIVSSAGVIEFGLVLGYSPVNGISAKGLRPSKIDTAGFFGANSRKIYSKDITGAAAFASAIVPVDSTWKCTAYRHVYNIAAKAPDASVATWFEDGPFVVVIIDFHKMSTLTLLQIPVNFDGWFAQFVDSSNVKMLSPVVNGGYLAVACSATYGFAEILLTAP